MGKKQIYFRKLRGMKGKQEGEKQVEERKMQSRHEQILGLCKTFQHFK